MTSESKDFVAAAAGGFLSGTLQGWGVGEGDDTITSLRTKDRTGGGVINENRLSELRWSMFGYEDVGVDASLGNFDFEVGAEGAGVAVAAGQTDKASRASGAFGFYALEGEDGAVAAGQTDRASRASGAFGFYEPAGAAGGSEQLYDQPLQPGGSEDFYGDSLTYGAAEAFRGSEIYEEADGPSSLYASIGQPGGVRKLEDATSEAPSLYERPVPLREDAPEVAPPPPDRTYLVILGSEKPEESNALDAQEALYEPLVSMAPRSDALQAGDVEELYIVPPSQRQGVHMRPKDSLARAQPSSYRNSVARISKIFDISLEKPFVPTLVDRKIDEETVGDLESFYGYGEISGQADEQGARKLTIGSRIRDSIYHPQLGAGFARRSLDLTEEAEEFSLVPLIGKYGGVASQADVELGLELFCSANTTSFLGHMRKMADQQSEQEELKLKLTRQVARLTSPEESEARDELNFYLKSLEGNFHQDLVVGLVTQFATETEVFDLDKIEELIKNPNLQALLMSSDYMRSFAGAEKKYIMMILKELGADRREALIEALTKGDKEVSEKTRKVRVDLLKEQRARKAGLCRVVDQKGADAEQRDSDLQAKLKLMQEFDKKELEELLLSIREPHQIQRNQLLLQALQEIRETGH